MLSKERLEEIIGQFEHVIYPAEVGEMARELLSLQSLPAMAEVDAEYEGCFDGADHAASSSDAVKRLAAIARRAIASAQAERLRAYELDLCINEIKELKEQIAKLKRTLEQKQNWSDGIQAIVKENAILAGVNVHHSEAFHWATETGKQITALTTERDEARRLLKEANAYGLLGEIHHMAEYDGEDPSRVVIVSREILKLCNGGRDDT